MSIVNKGWSWANATPQRKRISRIALGTALVLAVPALWLAWWLGSPLFIDKVANEEFPLTASATIPEGITQVEAESMMETASKIESQTTESMTPEMSMPSTVSLISGTFRDEEPSYRGSGEATIYRLEDDSNVLRLENFKVTNGPDLRVLLMVDPEGRDKAQGYIELGQLKGNIGNQNYPIPADTDISAYNAVMIYCRPFQVIFSTAPLN